MINIFGEEKEKLCSESKQTNFYRTGKSTRWPLAPNMHTKISQNIHHLINIPNYFLPRNLVFYFQNYRPCLYLLLSNK